MGLVFDMLGAPVLGPIKGIYWLARQVIEQAEREYLDEDPVRAQLMELQARFDLGEVSEEDYDEREGLLLERLNEIRQLKNELGRA